MQRFKFSDKVSEVEGVNIRDPIIFTHRKQTNKQTVVSRHTQKCRGMVGMQSSAYLDLLINCQGKWLFISMLNDFFPSIIFLSLLYRNRVECFCPLNSVMPHPNHNKY